MSAPLVDCPECDGAGRYQPLHCRGFVQCLACDGDGFDKSPPKTKAEKRAAFRAFVKSMEGVEEPEGMWCMSEWPPGDDNDP
jgi:hypothetical protein